MLKLIRTQGIEGLEKANWTRGGIRHPWEEITEEEKDWATSYITLKSQIGFNMKE